MPRRFDPDSLVARTHATLTSEQVGAARRNVVRRFPDDRKAAREMLEMLGISEPIRVPHIDSPVMPRSA